MTIKNISLVAFGFAIAASLFFAVPAIAEIHSYNVKHFPEVTSFLVEVMFASAIAGAILLALDTLQHRYLKKSKRSPLDSKTRVARL